MKPTGQFLVDIAHCEHEWDVMCYKGDASAASPPTGGATANGTLLIPSNCNGQPCQRWNRT